MDGDNSSDMWSWGLRRKEVNKSWILTSDLKQIYPMNICRVSLFSWPHSWLTQLMTPPFKRISPLETQKQHSVLCVCFFFLSGFKWLVFCDSSLCVWGLDILEFHRILPRIVSFLSSTLCFSNIVYIPFTCWQIPKVYPSDPHFKLQTHINNCLLNSPTLIPWSSQHPCFQNKPNNPTFTWKKPSPF